MSRAPSRACGPTGNARAKQRSVLPAGCVWCRNFYPVALGTCGGRSKLQHICHPAELWKRTCLHLSHQIAAVHLHGRFGDAHFVGDLFVKATSRCLNHDLALAGAQRLKTLPKHTRHILTLSTGTIASETGLDRVEEFLITERLREELYCTALHRLHGHRNVGMRRDKNDWKLPVRGGKIALKLETALPRHSNVEHHASRTARNVRLQEIGNR